MAKARKKARRSAAKRVAKKTRRSVKAKTKSKAKKTSKSKARRAKAPKEGVIARAAHLVTDTIHDAAELRRRMEGRETFED